MQAWDIIKGSAVNSAAYYDPNSGTEQGRQSYAMEFHNLSLGFGVKQRKEVGTEFFKLWFWRAG